MNVLPAYMYVHHVSKERIRSPATGFFRGRMLSRKVPIQNVYGHLVLYFKPHTSSTPCYLLDFTSFILRNFSELSLVAYIVVMRLRSLILHSKPGQPHTQACWLLSIFLILIKCTKFYFDILSCLIFCVVTPSLLLFDVLFFIFIFYMSIT